MYTEQTSETQKLVGDNSNTDKKKKKYCIWGTFIAILIIAVIIIIVVVVESSSDDDEQSGSSPIDWTSKFLELPSNETASNNSYHLTEFPHIAGTQQNNDYAQWLKDKLEDFGFESWLDQHENIYLSRYIDSSLQEIDPLNNSEILRDFNLDEGIIESDPTSSTELRSHAWIAYAATGQAIGPLAYVNYGSRKDFLNLTENGVNLTGTIGIVKYGGGMFRGQKAEQATEFGMIGLIIYSDPNDYGTGREEGIYPQGPWLPSTGYQRGSIIAGYMCPGNPSPDRLQDKCDKEFDEFMPSIPVIPMGYQNAYLLMSKMNGISVDSWQQDPDRSWQGGMNFTYHIGGYQDDINDEVWVNLEVENDNNATYTITNVVGKIEGDKYPDEHILIGNHFDAWIFGAADPISGTVASLEIARSFGEMIEDGWKPARSIYIAYWDAEEYALIGSCEYAENNAEMLQDGLVSYMNTDVAVGGPFIYARGDPMLGKFMIDNMKDIELPYSENGTTLYQQWIEVQSQERSLQALPFGYGSDYASFVEHLGLPAMDTGFTGTFGSYHSVYDSFTWIRDTVDNQFHFHRGLAQYFGKMALELVSNDILPYNVSNLYVSMSEWLEYDIMELVIDNQCDISNGSLLSNMTNILRQEIENFGRFAFYLQSKIDALKETKEEDQDDTYEANVTRYNKVLQGLYQQFLIQNGLPDRPYFKSILMAPDIDSGYEPQVFPYLAFVLKYTQCDESMIEEAYMTTTNVLKDVILYLEDAADIECDYPKWPTPSTMYGNYAAPKAGAQADIKWCYDGANKKMAKISARKDINVTLGLIYFDDIQYFMNFGPDTYPQRNLEAGGCLKIELDEFPFPLNQFEDYTYAGREVVNNGQEVEHWIGTNIGNGDGTYGTNEYFDANDPCFGFVGSMAIDRPNYVSGIRWFDRIELGYDDQCFTLLDSCLNL